MAPSRPDNKTSKPDIAKLIVDAQTQLEIGKLDEAATLAQQALDATGQGGDFELSAANLLGTIFIESGDIDEARAAFERAVFLDQDGTADEKIGGGPEKFLLLAQLSEEGGLDTVQWFERGAAALRKQIQALTEIPRVRVHLPTRHDFGFSLFGIRIFNFTINSELMLETQDNPPRIFHQPVPHEPPRQPPQGPTDFAFKVALGEEENAAAEDDQMS